MNYLLSESQEPIQQALERLIDKDEALHPFVVVEKVGRPDVFVQFATKNGLLYFDVPRFRITLDETTCEEGAVRAVAELTALGVEPGERVLILEEEEDENKGWGEPIRRPRTAL